METTKTEKKRNLPARLKKEAERTKFPAHYSKKRKSSNKKIATYSFVVDWQLPDDDL